MKTLEFYRSRTETATEWRWRLLARNGRIIATSGEGYERLGGAKKGAQAVTAYLLRVDVKTRTTRRGWLEESTWVEPTLPENGTWVSNPRQPKFYGRAQSLDGPRATVTAEERDAYIEDVKKITNALTESRDD